MELQRIHILGELAYGLCDILGYQSYSRVSWFSCKHWNYLNTILTPACIGFVLGSFVSVWRSGCRNVTTDIRIAWMLCWQPFVICASLSFQVPSRLHHWNPHLYSEVLWHLVTPDLPATELLLRQVAKVRPKMFLQMRQSIIDVDDCCIYIIMWYTWWHCIS